MTVEDFSIFGISVSILISLVSAGIALVAVYYTSKSVKISHNQLELELKKIEKPRVLERIVGKINILENELKHEIHTIENQDFIWFPGDSKNPLFQSPLVFPLSPEKTYYIQFRDAFTGPERSVDPRIPSVIDSIQTNLNKRRDIYQLLGSEFHELKNTIVQKDFSGVVNSILNEIKILQLKPVEGKKDLFRVFRGENDFAGEIERSRIQDLILSMFISQIFKPLKKDEFRLGCLGHSFFTEEIFPIINKSIDFEEMPDASNHKKTILHHAIALKNIDELILADIVQLKAIYRDQYCLTDQEMEPFAMGKW